MHSKLFRPHYDYNSFCFLIGHWGFDRFFIKQIGLGILKLFTGGGGGIWTIVDWFRIGGLTKKANMKKFNENLMLIK